MARLHRCLLVGLLVLAAGVPLPAADDDDRPWAERPYLGLSTRDTDAGLVVGWIYPGPLGGRGFASASGIQRGDNVVAVDGVEVDAERMRAHLRKKAPGDAVALTLRRSPDARVDSAVPRGGAGGEPFEVHVTLGSRERWGGLLGRGLEGRLVAPAREGAFEAMLLAEAGALGVRDGLPDVGGGLDALLAHLGTVQEDALDPGSLPAVVQCFRRPLSIDAVEARIEDAAGAAASGDLAAVEVLVRHVLDLADPDETIREVMGKRAGALEAAEARSMIRFAGQHLEQCQNAQDDRVRVERLLATLRTSVTIYDDHAEEHVETIARSAGRGVSDLLALELSMLRLAPSAWDRVGASHAQDVPLDEVPEGVRDAVQGDVLWWGRDALGHPVVVGGPGSNTYDMARIAAVYDVGGDDRYEYGAAPEHGAIALRLVVDLDGDDVHEALAPFEGPATGVFGLSFLDDRLGNDVYRTRHAFGVGAGLMGLGILVDRAGDDVYESTGEASGWGIGAGFWGAGLVIDRRGHDVYRGEKYVQGVGGPRGFGAILDTQGRDLYEANGRSFASVYGTAAVYVGMSQGFGFGVRGYAAGGVGAIYDFAGNDRYEAGEFSQAGGYFFGLGILHDARGHDLYYGNRYGQAFSAHQAIGILVDDEGDDTYWSMTAASQAGTWDESIGFLIDRQGNDAYRCDGLGQGGASMQAIAVLLDLAGDDRYSGSSGSVQGRGGGNRYHYDATGVFSFSGLFDLGSGRDVYSSGRENDTRRRTGAYRAKDPARSDLYGVFVDR